MNHCSTYGEGGTPNRDWRQTDTERCVERKLAAPLSEAYSYRRCGPREASASSGISSRFRQSGERGDRGEMFSTPDTSFGKKADQRVLTGASLESKLRQAAYESVAKRRKIKHIEASPGSPVQDLRAFKRTQDWVANVRHDQVC